ncbi:MAG TPA: hypothetical protein VK760_12410, partial [Candidatus Acidoferrales bacterium]|nr:hypothetical protein [Candidatus Acidoferrales bacterium]
MNFFWFCRRAAVVLTCGSFSLGVAGCAANAALPGAKPVGALAPTAARADGASGKIQLSLTIPSSGQLLCSKDGFISPETTGIKVTVNGVKLPVVRTGAGRVSTTFSAPAGHDAVVAELDASGAAISQASFTALVSSGKTTNAAAKFEGIAAFGTLATKDPNPPVGHPSQIPITLAAQDAKFEKICGSYAFPVAVEMLDAKPSVTPLTGSFSSPTQTVNFTYDGKLRNPT